MANKGISTGNIPLDKLPEALTEILTDFQHASFDTRQKAVQAGAEVFKGAVEAATPRDTGKMAQSWQIKTKYKDRRYVGNTRVASGDVRRKTKDGTKGEARSDVPLSNVLEYSDTRITVLYEIVLTARSRKSLKQSKTPLNTEVIVL